MSTRRHDPRTGEDVERGTTEYFTVLVEDVEKDVRQLRESVEEMQKQVQSLKHWFTSTGS